MKKRLISIMLVLMMLLTVLPAFALAEGEQEADPTLTWAEAEYLYNEPPYWGIPENAKQLSSLSINSESIQRGMFYFGTEDNKEPVDVKKLSYDTDSISIDSEYGTFLIKPCCNNGNVIVTYTDNDVSASMTINIVNENPILPSIPQLSAPTDLVWHKEYMVDWNSDGNQNLNCTDRIGTMSFKLGETRADNYSIELYRITTDGEELVMSTGSYIGDTYAFDYSSNSNIIYNADLTGGTYQYRVKAIGDGTNYLDSEWVYSSEWEYTKPETKLSVPDASKLEWTKQGDFYYATWEPVADEEVYEYWVIFGCTNQEGNDIEIVETKFIDDTSVDSNGKITCGFPPFYLEEFEGCDIFYTVRAVPQNIIQIGISDWSAKSPALDPDSLESETPTTDPEPTDPEPTDPEPTDPEPTDPEPTDPEPTDPTPTEPTPIVPSNPEQPENPETPVENNFVDVSEDDYYFDAVLWASSNGITSGTDETHFSPNDKTTRAQMVSFLYRAAGSPEVDGTLPFTDVEAGSYYEKAVIWAVQNGITSGVSEDSFAPEAYVTRAQAVTYLARFAGVKDSDEAKKTAFADIDTDSYYAGAVVWAFENGITSGTSETTFSPDDSCIRGQIVTFLYRYFK